MTTTYKIGEAAALLNLKTYVLRFWETEFPEIVPMRTEKGQRLYTEGHLALLERIRYLLHERGLTIGGARRALAEEKARGLVYVFGAPSAVAGGDKQDGLVLDPALESEDAVDPAADTADTDDEQGAADMEGDVPLPPQYQAGGRTRPQFNLPGLEELVALSKAVTVGSACTDETPESADFDDWLDEGSDDEPGYGRERQPLTSPEAGLPTQDILPLFGMIRNVLQTGKVAGVPIPGQGGSNFIQAGVDSAPTAGPGTGGAPCACAKDAAGLGPAGGALPPAMGTDAMRLLIEELEQVARILRADSPADKPADSVVPEAGKRGLRLIL